MKSRHCMSDLKLRRRHLSGLDPQCAADVSDGQSENTQREDMSFALHLNSDIARRSRHFAFMPILLQRVFLGDERKIFEPLMRVTSGDVRDHIVSSKNRSRTSVVALKSDAAAEKSADQLSRDF